MCRSIFETFTMVNNRYICKTFLLCVCTMMVTVTVLMVRQNSCVCPTSVKVELSPPAVNNTALLESLKKSSAANTGPAVVKCAETQSADRQRLNRDILEDISEGNVLSVSALGEKYKIPYFEPGQLPNTAHFVWCGKKEFKFHDYLGVLSLVRVLKPAKLVFHYNELPVTPQLYNTWFQELRQSLPYLVLRNTNRKLDCGTVETLSYGLEQLGLSVTGGVFLGEKTVLTHLPRQWKSEKFMTYVPPNSRGTDHVIVYARRGHVEEGISLEEYKTKVINKTFECITSTQMNEIFQKDKAPSTLDTVSPCLALPSPLYPQDIIRNDSPFGALARRLYYGKSEIIEAKQGEDPNDLIPAISHMISLNPKIGEPVEWTFPHYLSALSALYLGGFERLYVHGDTVPSGKWWDKLKGENISFVYVEKIETVFQQEVKVLSHQSDIIRTMILLKYGGAYQDKDVMWANPVSRDIRRYPTLMAYDWPIYEEWPRAVNIGVFMAKPGATFLRKLLDSFWYQVDSSWIFNAILMPYKVYERNPESVYIYNKLQVICYNGACHPAWHDDYQRTMGEGSRPTDKFNVSDPNAFHFTYPKPDPSLTSFSAIVNGTNLPAELGRNLIRALEKAGKKHLTTE